jgi:hypothetical protein
MGWSFDDLSTMCCTWAKGVLGKINRAWQVLPANGKKLLLWERRRLDLLGVYLGE